MPETTYRLTDLDEQRHHFVLLSGCSAGGKSTLLAALARRASATRTDQRTFFDRGVVDAVSFLEHLGLPVPPHLENAVQRVRYHETVFMTPPWPEIFTTDPERRHGFNEAVANYASLRRTYERLGYTLVELPRRDVESRCSFVLDRLASPS